jgi:endonuclease/exonuclease/phosphatase family metal-dependent hydrolase
MRQQPRGCLEVEAGEPNENLHQQSLLLTMNQSRSTPLRAIVCAGLCLALIAVIYTSSNEVARVQGRVVSHHQAVMEKESVSQNLPQQINLKIVTMNIAGLEPSQSAPSTWTDALQQETLLGELLRSDPDILALQECPSVEWAKSGIFNHDATIPYQLVGNSCTRSHAGFVCLFIKESLVSTTTATTALPLPTTKDNLLILPGSPIVATVVRLSGGQPQRKIAIASVHLEPFEDGDRGRQSQVEELIDAAAHVGVDALIFMGDTNMRDEEDETMEGELGLMDAWKQSGALEETRYSWDTMPHSDKDEFISQNLYYGHSTRAYQRRYDRIYVLDLHQHDHKSKSPSFHLAVPSLELIANQPIAPTQTQFLSDHFGIAAELCLIWSG